MRHFSANQSHVNNNSKTLIMVLTLRVKFLQVLKCIAKRHMCTTKREKNDSWQIQQSDSF